jgi:hypothetical protein
MDLKLHCDYCDKPSLHCKSHLHCHHESYYECSICGRTQNITDIITKLIEIVKSVENWKRRALRAEAALEANDTFRHHTAQFLKMKFR